MSAERYQSFLLKLWMRGEASASQLLMALENTRTGERHVFTDLGDLLDYLNGLTSDDRPAADASTTSRES